MKFTYLFILLVFINIFTSCKKKQSIPEPKPEPDIAETIYLGSYNYTLYALDAANGVEKWGALTGGRIISSPTVANGVVYVGSTDKKLHAFEPLPEQKNGNLLLMARFIPAQW
jgi:outer membrane protein assembly factor BamB